MSKELFVRQDIGNGDPLVLLHGMFGDGTQWDKIAPMLAKDFRVISLDLLGHGRSPRPKDSQYTAKEHADALHFTLQKLKATESLTVVGYSMGGAAALQYCADYPDGVAQLYMISTPFYLKPSEMISIQYSNSMAFIKLSSTVFKFVENHLLPGKLINKIVPYGDKSNKFHQMIGSSDNKLDPEIIRKNIKNMVREFDFTGALARVKAPISYYAGTRDPFVVQGQIYALKKIQPNMDIQRLDIVKVDHMLVQNLPKEMVSLISKHKQKTLHVGYDIGKGKPLVLLHGIESSHSYWEPVASVLAENHRVIALDLLGFGQSPKPLNIAYSLDDHVDWVVRTLDELGVKNYDIAGHSLGSLVSLGVAAKNPKNIRSLTLLSPVLVEDMYESNKFVLKQLQFIDQFSETSAVFSRSAKALGDKRIAKYVPSVRSIQNAIKPQNAMALAKSAKSVPAKLIYGTADHLVDAVQVRNIAKRFENSEVVVLDSKSHNFPLFSPETVITAIDGDKNHTKKCKKPTVIPGRFVSQLAKLAVPVLGLKSLLYIIVGALLFTRFAPQIIVMGLAIYVLNMGLNTIRGAFSLKNEGLAYIGYFILGIFVVVVGYGLFKHMDLSLHIAIFTICSLVMLNGILRLITSIFWASQKMLKRTLLVTGTLMGLAGLLGIFGGIISIYIIIYSIAIYLIIRGAQYGSYAIGALTMAYIRGFNSH